MLITVIDSVSSFVCEFDVPDDDAAFTVGTLKAMIELDMQIPKNQQELSCGLRTLTSEDDDKTLAAAGITDRGTVQVSRKGAATSSSTAAALNLYRALGSGMTRNIAGPPFQRKSDEQLKQQVQQEATNLLERAAGDPLLAEGIAVRCPSLAEALRSGNRERVVQSLVDQQREHERKRLEEQQSFLKAIQDPLNPESQGMMLKQIQQQSIQDSYEQATEFLPESFVKVVMLYVPAQINDTHVAAFVDTGAESTIMALETARRCGIDRLIDTRFAGLAMGVGRCKIVGRVHLVKLKLGNRFMQTSLNVLEDSKIDLLLGLELLRRFQCEIDLKSNCLKFEGESVPFMSEKEITDFKLKFSLATPSVTSTAAPPQQNSPPVQNPIQQTQNPQKEKSEESTDEKLNRLMSLGFGRNEARNALIRAGGNVDLAASLLFQFG